jgi:hypothetical protein
MTIGAILLFANPTNSQNVIVIIVHRLFDILLRLCDNLRQQRSVAQIAVIEAEDEESKEGP